MRQQSKPTSNLPAIPKYLQSNGNFQLWKGYEIALNLVQIETVAFHYFCLQLDSLK